MFGNIQLTEKYQTERKLFLTSATLIGLGAGMMIGTNVKADSTGKVNSDQDQTEQTTTLPKADDGQATSPTDTDDNDSSSDSNEDTSTNDQSDFSFSQDSNGNYTVTGYTGAAQKAANGGVDPTYSTDITIPDTYKNNPVTAIGDNAFNNEAGSSDNLSIVDGLTSVTFGKNIQQIGNYAFAGNKLTSIDLPDSTWSIGSHAFEDNQLSDIKFNNVQLIGDYAFANNKLTKVSLPDSTWSIGAYAFTNNQINDINLNKATVINDYAFSDNNLSKLVIPDKTTTIGNFAFEGNNIADLTLGSSLGTIGTSAFQNNDISGVIKIPASVENIGDYAFLDNKITGLVFGDQTSGTSIDKLATIGTSAFQGNQITGTVTLPELLTDIGDYAFADNKITDLVLNNKVTKINTGVFENNELNELILPDNITNVGNSAFYNNKIESLSLDQGLDTIGTYSFAKNNLSDNLIVPSGVTSVGESAFANNGLTGVDLKGSLDNLGSNSFNSNDLQNINIEQNIKAIGDGSFSNQKHLSVTTYASVTKALDVKKNIAKQLGLSVDRLSGLKFILDNNVLDYDESKDELSLPKDYQGKDIVMKLVLTSNGSDTGWYGTNDLELNLKKKMIIADVTIPSNLEHDPVVPKVEGQLGAQVKLVVPTVSGYTVIPASIYATVNDDTITANNSVIYQKNAEIDPDPDDNDSGSKTDPGTEPGKDTNNDSGKNSNSGSETKPDNNSGTNTNANSNSNSNTSSKTNANSSSGLNILKPSSNGQKNIVKPNGFYNGQSGQVSEIIVNGGNDFVKPGNNDSRNVGTSGNIPENSTKLPQTSDKSNVMTWIGVIILGFLGIFGFDKRKN